MTFFCLVFFLEEEDIMLGAWVVVILINDDFRRRRLGIYHYSPFDQRGVFVFLFSRTQGLELSS